MKKGKERKKSNPGADKPLTLGDMLNEDIMKQLKEAKTELKKEEEKKKLEEERKKREERKRREKNKSFEELLNESDLDWRQFK